MNRSRITPRLLALALAVGFAAPAARAAITFTTPTTIAGDADAYTTGTFLQGTYWRSAAGGTSTINGVTFTSSVTASGNVGTYFNVAGTGMFYNGTNPFTTAANPYNSLSASYKTMLSGGIYGNNNTVTTVTMQNLTAGRQYAVQFWVNDPRSTIIRSESLTSVGGNSQTLQFNSSGVGTNGSPGQYTIGYFGVGGTTEAFTITPVTGTTPPQLEMLQLRDVTNLGAWNGVNGATWDTNTTANFSTNLYSNAFSTGTMTAANGIVPNVYFADVYYNSNVANTVTQTAVNVAAGGVSTSSVQFINSSINYTLTSADANGIKGTTRVVVAGAGTVNFNGANTYTGATTVSNGRLKVGSGGSLVTTAIGVTGGTFEVGGGSLSNTALVIGNGAFELTGGSITSNAGFRLGNLNNDVSTATVSGGSAAFTAADFMLGSNNANKTNVTYTQTNGTVSANTNNAVYIGTSSGAGSSADFNVSGGTFSSNNEIWLGLRSNSTLNVSGTGIVSVNRLRMDLNAGVTGTVNLDGGTLQITDAYRVNGVGTFNLNLNGGTLKAKAGTGNMLGGFNTRTVKIGGAIIDTNGFNVTIAQALVHDAGLGATPDGGLTKLGGGTLFLTTASSYTGDTEVVAGTLSINAAFLDNLADVLVSSGAVFNLNFAGIDTIGGLFLNGVQQAAGTWGATGSGATYINDTYFTGTGRLLVTEIPPVVVPAPEAISAGLALLALAAARRRRD